MKNIETKEKFLALRVEGSSIRAASQAAGIDKTTGQKWQKEFEAEIATRKAERLEEAYQKYGAAKVARVTAYGETLARIEEALGKRNLDEVPTEKLLDFKIKYINALAGEFAPIPVEQEKGGEFVAMCQAIIEGAISGEVTPETLAKQLQEIEKADKSNTHVTSRFTFGF